MTHNISRGQITTNMEYKWRTAGVLAPTLAHLIRGLQSSPCSTRLELLKKIIFFIYWKGWRSSFDCFESASLENTWCHWTLMYLCQGTKVCKASSKGFIAKHSSKWIWNIKVSFWNMSKAASETVAIRWRHLDIKPGSELALTLVPPGAKGSLVVAVSFYKKKKPFISIAFCTISFFFFTLLT